MVWVCAHASSFLTIVVLNSIMGHLALFRGLTWILWDHPAPGAGTRGARGERIRQLSAHYEISLMHLVS